MINARKQQGFTLIEAIIVMLIIGILAAWAFPSFLDMRDRIALRSVGEDMLTSLAEARLDAAKQGRPVNLDFRKTINRLPPRISVVEDTTIGESSSTLGQVLIEPRLSMLANPSDAGVYELQSGDYYLRFTLSPIAQGRLCDPGTGKNPGVPAC